MIREEIFNFIKPNKLIEVLVDSKGVLADLFSFPRQTPTYLFILCTEGACELSTYLSTYTLKANDFITIFPNSYIHVLKQSENCCLNIISFDKQLVHNTPSPSFTAIMDCVDSILQTPILTLQPEVAQLIKEYMLLLQKATQIEGFNLSPDLAATQLLSFFHGVRNCYQINKKQISTVSRGEEIVKELARHIIRHYKQERNVAFYANLLHISPQHLSSTVSKITGQTVTDIIAKLVITDASSKLKSSDMSIQEIAYALNFSDISFFGKYFKRYTGMSPRQYREV
ncbi:MAG: AraC family transcriptional regulator [Phocaeicola sp.]